jgi:hypothetical protein
MFKNVPDLIDPKELTGSQIASAVAAHEDADAQGHYVATMTGPVEDRRSEYCAIMEQIAEIEAKNLITRLLLTARLDRLREKLATIPVETKWQDTIKNLVTTVGKNNILDNHFAGSAYTAAWYLGLISLTGYGVGVVAADTMASHAGWTEDVGYSNASRVTTAWSAAAAGSKTLSTGAVFNMNATTTIKGCFLASVNTKSGGTGILYSGGLFTGGDQPVVTGNTLTVTYTASV